MSLLNFQKALAPWRSDPDKVLDSVTVAAADSISFPVSNTNGYSAIVLTIKATYNTSATAGIRVRWLYSPDDITYDSEDAAENEGQYQDLVFVAGATKVETVLIPIFQPYIKVQVVNQDIGYAVIVDVWKTLLR